MTRPPKIHAPIQGDFNSVLKTIADKNKPETKSVGARPFLKWVGGKRSVIQELIARMPASYGTYREAFVGGGALFFAVQPTTAYLSDINVHLMLTYQAVRDNLDRLIALLKVHDRTHSPTHFQNARRRLSSETDTTKLAALVIYLNKTCFNGLYRVNRAGQFNVPMGSYKAPTLFDEDILRTDSQLLQGAELKQHSFWQTPVHRDDFYYLDPPYHQVYANYDSSGFGEDDHRRLALFCKELQEAEAYFMLSNSDTPLIRTLFARFHIEEVAASRSVSCKGNGRGKETELVIRNYK